MSGERNEKIDKIEKADILGQLEGSIDTLIEALGREKERSKALRERVAELELMMSRAPKDNERLEDENRRLKRNMDLAASKISDILKRI